MSNYQGYMANYTNNSCTEMDPFCDKAIAAFGCANIQAVFKEYYYDLLRMETAMSSSCWYLTTTYQVGNYTCGAAKVFVWGFASILAILLVILI
jgi:hypothetical protein